MSDADKFCLERLIAARKMRTHCTKYSNDDLLDEIIGLYNKYYLPEILKLTQANKKLEALLSVVKDADNYLDINEYTTICHNSILHRGFKDALAQVEKNGG